VPDYDGTPKPRTIWIITLGNTPQPQNEGNFTALGRVVRGMDVSSSATPSRPRA
jgi:hypothetical protein